MLTYKVSTENINRKHIPLTPTSIVLNEAGKELIITTSEKHRLHVGEKVLFTRVDGSEINWQKSLTVTEVVSEKIFKTEYFGIESIVTTHSGIYNMKFHPSYAPRDFLTFFISEEYPHNVLTNRDNVTIKERTYGNYETSTVEVKRCDGDYILYEDTFLYQATVGTDKYIFPAGENSKLNTACDLYIIPTGTLLLYLTTPLEVLGGQTPRGNTWEYDGNALILHNCFIPSRINGHDDRTKIMWEVESPTIASEIVGNASILSMHVKDERFITPTTTAAENGVICVLKPGTSVYKTNYSVMISDAITQDFGTNLFQEELLKSEYVDKIIAQAKNKIIDYEKQCFTPVYRGTAGTTNDVNEIIFNLHFRERPCVFDEELQACTYGEWKTDDTLYWNNYKYMGGNGLTPEPGIEVNDADLLGYLGFTDDDIYYQRNRVSHSFLRLSFFDTPDRRTQKMLFTSVIRLDSAALYEKYVANVRSGKAPSSGGCEGGKLEYVYSNDAKQRLDTSFSCKNKYESTSSSEGFYLYLYPGLLNEDIEGNYTATIYMKAEFNHAKYGYTIPMTLPLDNNGNAIDPTSADFPMSYVAENESGGTYIDTARLFNDMYIPIKVEFDLNSNRYVWYIENGIINDGVARFNMFEPRLNDEKALTVTLNSDTIGWQGGTIDGHVSMVNGGDWAVSSTLPEGVTVTPDSGEGETDIQIYIPGNQEGDPVETFAIVFSGGGAYARAEITRDANRFELTVSPTRIESPWNGLITELTITTVPSDIPWRVWYNAGYLTAEPRDGVGSQTITLTVGRNDSFESKDYWNLFIRDTQGYGAPRRVYVAIDGIPNNTYVSEDLIKAPYTEYTEYINIQDPDNLGWEAESYPSWIHISPYRSIGDCADISITFDKNEARTERSSSIIFAFGWNMIGEGTERLRYPTEVRQEGNGDGYVFLQIGEAYFTIPGETYDGYCSYEARVWTTDSDGVEHLICSTISNGRWVDPMFLSFDDNVGLDVSQWMGEEITIQWQIDLRLGNGAHYLVWTPRYGKVEIMTAAPGERMWQIYDIGEVKMIGVQ